jgi:hypothetical protein
MIATRVLKLQRERDVFEVVIRIFAPQDRDGSGSCRYEIDWPEGRRTMEAFGVDSIQAILLERSAPSFPIRLSQIRSADVP